MQAETLSSAYRLWRRNWAGKGREYSAGALVWQVRTITSAGLSARGRVVQRLLIVATRRLTTAGHAHPGP